MELSYSTELILQCPALSVTGYYQWNMGDMFDPDRTAAGQQWLYRDQFVTLYKYYRAVRVSFEAVLTSYVTNVGDGILACVLPQLSGDTSATATVSDYAFQPLSQVGVMQSGAPSWKVSGSYNPWELLGITRKQWESDNTYLTAVGSQPTNQCGLMLAYKSYNSDQPVLVGYMRLRTVFGLYSQVVQGPS